MKTDYGAVFAAACRVCAEIDYITPLRMLSTVFDLTTSFCSSECYSSVGIRETAFFEAELAAEGGSHCPYTLEHL